MPNDNSNAPGPDHPNPRALVDAQLERARLRHSNEIAIHFGQELQKWLIKEDEAATATNPPPDVRREAIREIYWNFYVWMKHRLDVLEQN